MQFTTQQYALASTVTAMPTDSDTATSRRVPKLAVRNRNPDIVSGRVGTGRQSDQGHDDLGHIRPGPSNTSNDSALQSTPRHSSSLDSEGPSKTKHVSSERTSGREKPAAKHASKRKFTGVLGFFTLKEPSNSALEEFAEQERRKMAAQKGSKLLPGVSSQKIPEHVPKVNSKWDGLPDSTKGKTTNKDRSSRNSGVSLGSCPSETSERGGVANLGSFSGIITGTTHLRQLNEKRRENMTTMELQKQRNGGSTSFLSIPSPPATPPELERCASPSGICAPNTPESSPRTPNLESERQPKMHSLAYATGMWHYSDEQATVQSSGASEPPVAVVQQKSVKPSSRAQVKCQHTLRPCGNNDVAPWESFEPPEQLARRPQGAAAEVARGECKKSTRLGARLGFR